MRSDTLHWWVSSLNAAIADRRRETDASPTHIYFDADVIIDAAFSLRQIKKNFDELPKSGRDDEALRQIVERSATSQASIAAAFWAMGRCGRARLLPPHVLEVDRYVQRKDPEPTDEDLARLLRLVDFGDLKQLLRGVDDPAAFSAIGSARLSRLTGSSFVILQALSGLGNGDDDTSLGDLLDLSQATSAVGEVSKRLLQDPLTRELWTRMMVHHSAAGSRSGTSRWWDPRRWWQPREQTSDNPRNAMSDAVALVQLSQQMRAPENAAARLRFFTNTQAVLAAADDVTSWAANARDAEPIEMLPLDGFAVDHPNGLLRSGYYFVWRSLFPALYFAKRVDGADRSPDPAHDGARLDWSLDELEVVVQDYKEIAERYPEAAVPSIFTSKSVHHKWLFSNLDEVRQTQFIAAAWLQQSSTLHRGISRLVSRHIGGADEQQTLRQYVEKVQTRGEDLRRRIETTLGSQKVELKRRLSSYSDILASLPPAEVQFNEFGALLFAGRTGMDRWLAMPHSERVRYATLAREVWLYVAAQRSAEGGDGGVEAEISNDLSVESDLRLATLIASFAAGHRAGVDACLALGFGHGEPGVDPASLDELSWRLLASAAQSAFAALDNHRELDNLEALQHLGNAASRIMVEQAATERQAGQRAYAWAFFYWWFANACRSGDFHPVEGRRDMVQLLTELLPESSGGDDTETIEDVYWLLAAAAGDRRYHCPEVPNVPAHWSRLKANAIAWYNVSQQISSVDNDRKGDVQIRKRRADPWFRILKEGQQHRAVVEVCWPVLISFYKRWS